MNREGGRVDVLVAQGRLPMSEEAVRGDQVQIVLGPRHGHVEQASFLLDLFRRARVKIGRHAVDDEQWRGRVFDPDTVFDGPRCSTFSLARWSIGIYEHQQSKAAMQHDSWFVHKLAR